MMVSHRKGDEDSIAYAESTARILLAYADLPLLIRARACMVLGCSTEAWDYLDWAKEGVRIARLGIASATSVGEAENQLLADCIKVRDEAQEAFDAAGGQENLDRLRHEAEGVDMPESGELIESGGEGGQQLAEPRLSAMEVDNPRAEVRTAAVAQVELHLFDAEGQNWMRQHSDEHHTASILRFASEPDRVRVSNSESERLSVQVTPSMHPVFEAAVPGMVLDCVNATHGGSDSWLIKFKDQRDYSEFEAAVAAKEDQTRGNGGPSEGAGPSQGLPLRTAEDEEMLLTVEMEKEFLMPESGPGRRRKKKTRRIDSGYSEGGETRDARDYMVFDKESQTWVPLGHATDPAAEDEDVDVEMS